MTACLNNCNCCCSGNQCENYAVPGDPNRKIRVYGTLLNWTLDPNIANGVTTDPDYHNDALAYAYQLYDSRFYPNQDTIDNYQDMINKRLTAISFADTNGGVTTIENRDGSKGDPFMFIVKGNTNIAGDLHVDGDIYYKKPNGEYGKIDLSQLMEDVAYLKSMWEIDPNDNTQLISKVYNGTRRKVAGYGFYDVNPDVQ